MEMQERKIEQPWLNLLLGEPLLARLATANATTLQPHVVPVWFEWDGEAIWISSFNSTRKMRDLEGNPQVSIVIDVAENGETMQAILLEGYADVISDPAVVAPRSVSIYQRYLGTEGARASGPAGWAVDPENRLIRLVPERVLTWGS